jgi:hypothetical protein
MRTMLFLVAISIESLNYTIQKINNIYQEPSSTMIIVLNVIFLLAVLFDLIDLFKK